MAHEAAPKGANKEERHQKSRPRSYATDASRLLREIRCGLVHLQTSHGRQLPPCIRDLDTVLASCQKSLEAYQAHYESECRTLSGRLLHSSSLTHATRWGTSTAFDSSSSSCNTGKPGSMTSTKLQEEAESLLFHLVVSLNLCQLRVEEACALVGCQHKSNDKRMVGPEAGLFITEDNVEGATTGKSKENEDQCNAIVNQISERRTHEGVGAALKITFGGVILVGAMLLWSGRNGEGGDRSVPRSSVKASEHKYGYSFLKAMGKIASISLGTYATRRWWMKLCMKARIADSASAITLWQQKWVLLQCCSTVENSKKNKDTKEEQRSSSERNRNFGRNHMTVIQASSKQLLECIPLESPGNSFWHSQGALRFLLLKKATDLLYASVGTAIEVTGGTETSSGILWLPVAAAVASYYAITGPDATSSKATEALSSPFKSDLISRAWGMMSLPVIKRVSLEVSKLLLGAATAERIVIANVPCFVISKHRFPALLSALKRFQRQSRRKSMSNLSTIHEAILEEDVEEPVPTGKNLNHNRSLLCNGYPKGNIIFHITGGGFFAHTLASDIPFLIDWSGAANAVVVCPEYDLLPEHCFPVAINQITDIYCSLVNGDSAPLLGFSTNKIMVTGESAGGNLGAALCVKICMNNFAVSEQMRIEGGKLCGPVSDFPDGCKSRPENTEQFHGLYPNLSDAEKPCGASVRVPDAIMLCCPVLNLSLAMSPSRVMAGDGDPVLPSLLIETISDAYLPDHLGVPKDDPVASPYFAPDEALALFPPTRLYASSKDPLLDDSAVFNTRLRRLGVESDLCAAHNMPHAYWGLGTAGFPEAKQVQAECKEWIVEQFSGQDDHGEQLLEGDRQLLNSHLSIHSSAR